jgi:predicted molibdopterin-dependent oxidoreductase YjgC
MFSPELPRKMGEARAEWRILRDLAAATWPQRASLLGCETGQAIREEIARVVPFYDGVQNLRKTGDSIQWGGERLCENGRFATPDGKAHFRTVSLPVRASDDGKQFLVSTRRGKQFNTLIHAEIDPLTGAGRDAVFMNPEDAAFLHLARGDRVILTSECGRFEGRVFPALIVRGSLQVHWPEGNVLIRHGVVDAVGGVPDYNAWVRVERG